MTNAAEPGLRRLRNRIAKATGPGGMSDDKEAIRERIKAIDAEIDAAASRGRELEASRLELAGQLFDVVPGMMVTNNGKRFVVEGVAKYWGFQAPWLFVRQIKKDGTLGAGGRTIYSWERVDE